MTKIEMIYAEIEQVDDTRLDALYEHIKQFTQITRKPKLSLMEELMQIKIQAPSDFAENVDLYLSGEKQFESDIR